MVFKRLCSRRLQSLRMGVQNGGARFAGVESETSETSETSMEPENTSQSSHASQYSQTHCAGMVSRMRLVSVQNEADRCPEWGSPLRGSGPACGSRECGIDKLKVMKTVCICPECPKCRDRNGRNGQNGQGEMSKTPMGPIGHIGPIGPIKEYAAQGVQNEGSRCPK